MIDVNHSNHVNPSNPSTRSDRETYPLPFEQDQPGTFGIFTYMPFLRTGEQHIGGRLVRHAIQRGDDFNISDPSDREG